MDKQELIKKLEERKTIIGNFQGYAVWWEDIKEIFEELDEPSSGHAEEAPRYVKNVLARLRELPLHDREVWLKAIMSEFEQNFSHAKWREGYEQGKFEGALEREKVKIPQFVADWLSNFKSGLFGLNYDSVSSKIYDWVYATEDNLGKLHLAFVYGYEVEKEKRYIVRIKGVEEDSAFLNYYAPRNEWIMNSSCDMKDIRAFHTRKELEEAGFGWVFSCEGIKIEEVE